MKAKKLIAIVPLVSVITFGTVFAQGNPHQDTESTTRHVARIQGNPQIGFEARSETITGYRGNPHEGYISKVVHVARGQGNPHAGFKLVPPALASTE